MDNKQVLEGIRVLELGMAIAGPRGVKCLADFGATVVKVESIKRVDILRAMAPYAQNVRGINRSGFYQYNNNKYDIVIELPQGTEVIKKLVVWADVVVENFAAGVLDRQGLAYEDLKKTKPDLIMVRVSGQGQRGPYATQRGFGTQFGSLAGFSNLFTWPDREPVPMPNAYTDFITPWYTVITVIGALIKRRRTGEGEYVDLSQFESGVGFLSPAILDYAANQRIAGAMGNRCSYAAPHGAYRCLGDDRWCVIAVFSDEDWQHFCKAIGEPAWTKDAKFATLLARKDNEDELDKLVEEWTKRHTTEKTTEIMQAAGVAAGIVKNGADLFSDPQPEHRNYLWKLGHSEMGMTSYEGASFKLSKTPEKLTRPAPRLGQDTEYVCKQFLGMSDKEFDQLLAQGAIGLEPGVRIGSA